MILENTVPNPKSVAPKLQKLQSRKVPINVGHQRQRQRRHQSGKNYSLVEMKFRRDKKKLTNSPLMAVYPDLLSLPSVK